MAGMTVGDIVNLVDRLAPFRLAEPWDNVGLQTGDPARGVRKIGVALEATPWVVDEARKRRADVLIVHHPLIFKPLKSVSRETATGAMVSDLVEARIALIAAHTNLDASPCGTNAALAELLDLRETGPLIDMTLTPAAYKFVIFVPSGYERKAIEAIARGGGGAIGAYDRCSFRSAGVGTYRPLPGAKPFAGKIGRVEEAEELRLEAEVPREALARVLRETLAVHPYEEVAYDIYPRERAAVGYSWGVAGTLVRPASASSLARRIKRLLLGNDPVTLVGDSKKRIRRVAVFTGTGATAIEHWQRQADVLVTGEISHHRAREAEARGMTVIAAGHYATEQPVVPFFAEHLRRSVEIGKAQAEVLALTQGRSPYTHVR